MNIISGGIDRKFTSNHKLSKGSVGNANILKINRNAGKYYGSMNKKHHLINNNEE